MKLSAHFTLNEMTRSQYAIRHGIDNTPSSLIIERLRLLCENTLEPIRALFGVPVIISSGYRNPRVNAGIGGSKTSQHMRGEAADIELMGVSNTEAIIVIAKSDIPFDQLVREAGDEGWIHVSFRATKNRKEVLNAVFVNGQPEYSKFEV